MQKLLLPLLITLSTTILAKTTDRNDTWERMKRAQENIRKNNIKITVPGAANSSVIDNYLNSQSEKSMVCWEENKWVKYELRGDKLVLGGLFELPILENKGDIYAPKYFGSDLIVDFGKNRITMKNTIFALGGDLVQDCRRY